MADYKFHILVCGGTGCQSSNSHEIMEALKQNVADAGMAEDCKVLMTGCFGL